MDPQVPQVCVLSVIRPMITPTQPSNRLCFGTGVHQTTSLLYQWASVQFMWWWRGVGGWGVGRWRVQSWGKTAGGCSFCKCHPSCSRPLSLQCTWFQPPSSIQKPALLYDLRGTRSSQIGPLIRDLSPRSTEPLFQASFFK